MRLPLLALSFLLLAAGPTVAQVKAKAPQAYSADIFEFGLYESQTQGKVKNPNAPGGFTNDEVNIDHVATTTVIPAELEVEFGLSYELIGTPMGARVPVTAVIRFPQQGLREPGRKQPWLEMRQERMMAIGEGDFLAYSFEFPWEVVKGVWTFEIWAGGKKIGEQKFSVQ